MTVVPQAGSDKPFTGLAAGGGIIEDDGEHVDIGKFLGLTRQKVLVIDQGPSAPNRRPFSQHWAFSYEELCRWATLSWDEARGRGDDTKNSAGVIRWAEDGFTTLEAKDDLYAAALMCTTAEAVGMVDIHFPSPAVVFRIPPGLVDVEYARLDAARLGEVSLSASGGSRHRTIFMTSDTVDDLLFQPPSAASDEVGSIAEDREDPGKPGEAAVRAATEEEKKIFTLVRHYAAGLLIAYQQKSNWTYEGLRLARAKSVRGIPPAHRYAVLGRKVTADVREGVRRYAGGAGRRSPSFQFVVRGHYRNQAHGPGHALRRIQWIEPYWKTGKDADAPVLARAIAF